MLNASADDVWEALQSDRSLRLPFIQVLKIAVKLNKIFVVESGEVGFTPAHAMKGDVVCILHGFRMPAILRRTEEGVYMVVGWCYLEGAMFGEAVTWQEDEGDEFVLH